MAEENSGQEKTLEPSARRLEQARKEGQIPRSRYLAHVVVLGGAAAILLGLAGSLMNSGRDLMTRGLRFDANALSDPARMTARFGELGGNALLAVAPVLAVLLAACVAAPLLVGGWSFAPQAAAPKFDRLDPIKGFGRLFSLQAMVELIKVVLCALLLAVVGTWFVLQNIGEFAGLAHESLPNALGHFGTLAGMGFLMLVLTLGVVAAIDVPFQIFDHRRNLKMTMEEMKREMKETDGDPHIKARIRSVQREMARKRMMAAVPNADVVVTNPTHFAVALKYLEGQHRAPVVVAKGVEAVAEKIKELARENKVPLMEAPPLARSLYRHVDLGQEVPAALYAAVAQVLAYVFQLKRFAVGQAPRPVEPREFDVPEELQVPATAEPEPDTGATA